MLPNTVYDTLHDKFLAATSSDEAKEIYLKMDKEFIQQHIVVVAPTSYNYSVWQPWIKRL